MFSLGKKSEMPVVSEALPGRQERMPVVNQHFVNRTPLQEPFPEGMEIAMFGLGCFWGAERIFWEVEGVYSTAVGYAGGYTPNPTYQELCTGMTGHNEVVQVIYDPEKISYENLLKVFSTLLIPLWRLRIRSSSTNVAFGLSRRTVVSSRSGKVTSLMRAYAELLKIIENISVSSIFCSVI